VSSQLVFSFHTQAFYYRTKLATHAFIDAMSPQFLGWILVNQLVLRLANSFGDVKSHEFRTSGRFQVQNNNVERLNPNKQ